MKRTLLWLFCGLIPLAVLISDAPADTNTPGQPAAGASQAAGDGLPLQPDEVKARIEQFNNQLQQLQQTPGGQTPAEGQLRQQRIGDLTSTVSAYEQVLGAWTRQESLLQEKQVQTERQQTALQGAIAQKPPYPLALYDATREDRFAGEQRRIAAETAIRIAKQTIETQDKRLDAAQARFRLLSEKADAPAGSKPWELEEARLQQELAHALRLLERSYLANHQVEAQIAQLTIETANRKLERIRSQLVFRQGALDDQLAAVKSRQAETGRRLKQAMETQKGAEEAWLRAVKRFRGNENSPLAEAVLKSAEVRRNSQRTIVEQLFDSQRLLDLQKELWHIRYALINDADPAARLDEWQRTVDDFLESAPGQITQQQSAHTGIQAQIVDLETRVQQPLSEAQAQQLKALKSLAVQRQTYVATMIDTQRLARKLKEEIVARAGRLTVGQQLAGLREQLTTIWNYEIVDIDNRPVTIRKVVISLVILVIGIFVAKLAIRYITARLLKFARFRETTQSAIQKVVSFAAYLMVFLFALRMVNIPLAAFAFLGGAVAIGFGFGAQNLINNFISGFIIMGERPINIGDLIEVDGILGQVEEVGARCTRMRTGENIHILVPNSSLLEKNITNWTLSDQRIRTTVTVGVAYGSPAREVERLLLQAAREEPRILVDPAPFVHFTDFGDNALTFAVHFWIRIQRVIERRETESRLRFRIGELFDGAGIVIAFPQRDVHLDTQGPIPVRMVEGPER